MTDLVGGQVQIYVADLGPGMGMLKTDKVRAGRDHGPAHAHAAGRAAHRADGEGL